MVDVVTDLDAASALRAVRGKSGAQERVMLPEGWLADRDGDAGPDESALDGDPEDYEASLSGG